MYGNEYTNIRKYTDPLAGSKKYVRHLLNPNVFFGVIFPTAQLNIAVSNLKFRKIRDKEKEKLDALIRLRDRSVDWRI